MGDRAYQKAVDYYLKNRTPVNAKCMKPVTEPVDSIEFCSRLIMTDEPECYCKSYINPDAKWRNGNCNLADQFLKTVETKDEIKKRVGQQKQSKKKKSRR